MKVLASFLVALFCAVFSVEADLTIVQKVEGLGPVGEVTMKIKGDKARVQAGADVTTIIDAKSGDVTTLMNSQKRYVQMSGEKVKAMAAMMNQSTPGPQGAAKPKVTATGKKETINGYETEEFVCDAPAFKATYWVATKLPDGPAILKQMQAMQSSAWGVGSTPATTPPDLPGVPIRSRITIQGKEMTTTISSIKQDPVAPEEFSVPTDFKEMQIPNLGGKAPDPGKTKQP
jgi:hypothetical protein